MEDIFLGLFRYLGNFASQLPLLSCRTRWRSCKTVGSRKYATDAQHLQSKDEDRLQYQCYYERRIYRSCITPPVHTDDHARLAKDNVLLESAATRAPGFVPVFAVQWLLLYTRIRRLKYKSAVKLSRIYLYQPDIVAQCKSSKLNVTNSLEKGLVDPS